MPCYLDPLPAFPALPSARSCGTDVCMTPQDGAALWKWVRDARRWAELATVCLDARS